VNAQPMKAFRVMMDEEGCSIGKVAAMCGGPDWPTSVLCGLLKIPIHKPLVGLLPIIITIAPTTLMTAMGTFGPTGYPWDLLATLMQILFLAFQAGSMVLFAVYLEKTLREKADAVAAIPDDEEVCAYEESVKKETELTVAAVRFETLPGLGKFLITTGTIGAVLSGYLIGMDNFSPTVMCRTAPRTVTRRRHVSLCRLCASRNVVAGTPSSWARTRWPT